MPEQGTWSPLNPFPLYDDWKVDVLVHFGLRRHHAERFTEQELMVLERIMQRGDPLREDRKIQRKAARLAAGREWAE